MAVEDRMITRLTQARSDAEARALARKIRPVVLRAMADLLYVDPAGHGVAWLRTAVVNEARA